MGLSSFFTENKNSAVSVVKVYENSEVAHWTDQLCADTQYEGTAWVNVVHPEEEVNIYTKFYGNPSNTC